MELKELKLKQIKQEVLNCRKCPLYKTRNYPVIGEGNHSAKIMFVGEAPGEQEDKTGHPFCGRAGEILDQLLLSINLNRKEVYITNLLKCRPPQNRDPLPEEIKACSPYLLRQIELISPKIICPLGRYAMNFLMQRFGLKPDSISKIHGRVFKVSGLFHSLIIIPLYHPAVATYNPFMIEQLKKDFKILKQLN